MADRCDSIGIGDVVQLRSGGPAMTVIAILAADGDDRPLVRCQWFAGKYNGLLKTEAFPLESLRRIDPAETAEPSRSGV